MYEKILTKSALAIFYAYHPIRADGNGVNSNISAAKWISFHFLSYLCENIITQILCR